jgi:hypothetical protein
MRKSHRYPIGKSESKPTKNMVTHKR